MGLLPENSLLPVTSNRNMLAQALKARQQPRNQLTGQGLLDTAAIGLSPVPVIGDAIGLAADASRFYNEPESRTPLNFGLAALGAIPFIPPLVSMGLGKIAQSQGKTLTAPSMSGPARNQAGAIVYHGSPHKFDKFDSSKIGTGEGAQAYGHGLYFAENPEVAKSYKPKNPEWQGKKVDSYDMTGNVDFADGTKGRIADSQWSDFRSAMESAPRTGSLYKVDLPDEAIAKMLDWDANLADQPHALSAINKYIQEIKSAGLEKEAKDIIDAAQLTGMPAQYFYQIGKKSFGADALSKDLARNGIPGIKYLDGGSRSSGEGTRNFVTFPGNEGLLKILERQ